MTSSTRDILNNPIGPRDVVQHILLHHFDYFAKYFSHSITESKEMVLSTHIWAVNGLVTLNTVYFLPLEQGQFFSESLIDYS